jgi:hypothetical protein
MGWPGGILEGGDWGKPKGMHWRTYERLCREHDALSDRALVGIVDCLSPEQQNSNTAPEGVKNAVCR